ncbi:uncharacterized protein LOC117171698 isoform X3 [Belonocnema kinseyi]|uniref:uncharacterized protein LOC117171698 isoform X3 n=1 Tax=Belonocnema kinseyi TaxID=2817044 RepID=UPI00143DF870|nr:uncharacterized protein LOC117171698 isoform X3 [Belonocnema kinseyi]
MKIVTLLFAYVASLSFEKICAMNTDSGAGRDNSVNAERRPTTYPKGIILKRVVNGEVSNWHLLRGNLVPDASIETCNGPYGSVSVDLPGSERLYACLDPFLYHNETKNREHVGGAPIFLANVGIGNVKYRAVLAPSDVRSRVNSQGYPSNLGLQTIGQVRYKKPDRINPNNSIDVAGDLHRLPEEEQNLPSNPRV